MGEFLGNFLLWIDCGFARKSAPAVQQGWRSAVLVALDQTMLRPLLPLLTCAKPLLTQPCSGSLQLL